MASNLVFRLTGGASNSLPNSSLGGLMSSVALSGTSLNNLFDNCDSAERSAGDVEYRFLDVYNSGDTATTQQDFFFTQQTTCPDTVVAVGYDATAGSHATSANLQTLANEGTAPSSPAITFSTPTEGAPLSLPSIAAGQAVRLCFRRTLTSGATSFLNDSMSYQITYLG